MSVGRRFSACFQDDASRLAYLTWSAGQMFIKNRRGDPCLQAGEEAPPPF